MSRSNEDIWTIGTNYSEVSLGFLKRGNAMHMNIFIVPPLIALLSGIAILIWPRLLNYIVAFYLILIGLLGLGTHF